MSTVRVENAGESAEHGAFLDRTARLSLAQHDSAQLIDNICREFWLMPEFDFLTSGCSNTGGNCVEAARNLPRTVAVRDSKTPDGPILRLAPQTWTEFTASLR
ncbi:DUF397 domain-containing protein [Streptomyces sp. NPDC048665]|uniref:DUF397 domain-containing protein n=1 Tax=Streptomyces sp. NPDC048665 TaxID=3155490 RepID=UPI0034230A8A